MSSYSASLRCCSSSSPGDAWGTSRSGTRTSLRYRDRQWRRWQLKVSNLIVRERKCLFASLTRKEPAHVYHYHDVAPCGLLTAQASYHRASEAFLLCHRLCRVLDCHAAPGAGSECSGPAALHCSTSRALWPITAALLLCWGTGCHCGADPGRLYGDRGHHGNSRGAAVAAALCALAGWGPLVPARARWLAPNPTGVLDCLPGNSTTDGVYRAVAALLHDLPAQRPAHWRDDPNLGRRGLVGLRGPRLATTLWGLARLPGARSPVGSVASALLPCSGGD